ncbi:hypothetical protein BJ508DRAFT_331789 [Ascobolus immersus RN42]|uniref:Uncharacterized protein n=1 Tax=Ascobolus immersus RN42 TaxID=1160509 RepID=A0A3N4HUX1_ASCIM|nr:hypothetical protein BJ508DRAFT_331789 [Ascobolus immersus RN42]
MPPPTTNHQLGQSTDPAIFDEVLSLYDEAESESQIKERLLQVQLVELDRCFFHVVTRRNVALDSDEIFSQDSKRKTLKTSFDALKYEHLAAYGPYEDGPPEKLINPWDPYSESGPESEPVPETPTYQWPARDQREMEDRMIKASFVELDSFRDIPRGKCISPCGPNLDVQIAELYAAYVSESEVPKDSDGHQSTIDSNPDVDARLSEEEGRSQPGDKISPESMVGGANEVPESLSDNTVVTNSNAGMGSKKRSRNVEDSDSVDGSEGEAGMREGDGKKKHKRRK